MRAHNFRSPTRSAAAPFSGQGVSAYIGTSLPIQYRNLVALGPGFFPPVNRTITSVTTRAGSATGTAGETPEIELDLSAYASGTVYIDLRHYRDGVENEDSHPQEFALDGSGDPVNAIRGISTAAAVELRAGGILRFRFVYLAAADGVQPTTFELVRTAGPTSPAAVSITASGSGTYLLDTGALDDSDVYSFTLDAVLNAGEVDEVRQTLLTFTNLRADATGPAALTGLSGGAV